MGSDSEAHSPTTVVTRQSDSTTSSPRPAPQLPRSRSRTPARSPSVQSQSQGPPEALPETQPQSRSRRHSPFSPEKVWVGSSSERTPPAPETALACEDYPEPDPSSESPELTERELRAELRSRLDPQIRRFPLPVARPVTSSRQPFRRPRCHCLLPK